MAKSKLVSPEPDDDDVSFSSALPPSVPVQMLPPSTGDIAVKFRTLSAGPRGVRRIGEIHHLPAEEAGPLLKAGAVERVDKAAPAATERAAIRT